MWLEHGEKTRLMDLSVISSRSAAEYIERHRKQGDVFFVAEADGKVVGTVSGMLEDLPKYYRYDKRLLLDNLAVAPEYRGQGIAGKLLEACEAYAREHGIPTLAGEVWLFNDASRSVFTKQGYEPDVTHWYKLVA